MDKPTWGLHPMEYYSATKINEVLLHTITWMDFEKVMLSRRSQSSNPACHMILLYETLRTGTSIDSESRLVFAGAGAR